MKTKAWLDALIQRIGATEKSSACCGVWRRRLASFFVVAFLSCLFAPLAWSILPGQAKQSASSLENRKLAALPKLRVSQWRKLPTHFDRYFSDHLGMRRFFLNSYLRLFSRTLRSPVGSHLVGKHGELFEKNTVVAALGLNPKDYEFLAMLRTTAAGTAAFFFLQDIPYYLFLVPDKSTLYPEWLPFYAKFVEHHGWGTDFESALYTAGIHFYSLRDFFEKNKEDIRLYDKVYDTCHWNGYAIKLFYQNIQEFVSSDVYNFDIDNTKQYLETNKFEIKDRIYGRDYAQFVVFPQKEFLEDKTTEFFGKKRSGWWSSRYYINHNKFDKKILMISDSYLLGTHGAFTLPIFAFNSHQCMHIHFDNFSSSFFKKYINGNKPDIVIGEFVERMGGIGKHVIRDKKITMLGDVWTKTPGYIIDKNTLESANIVNAELSSKKNRIYLKAKDNDASIVFPDVMTDNYGHATVMARMKSKVKTKAFLYYTLEDGDTRILPESNLTSPTATIRKGNNYIHLHIFTTPNTKVKLHFVPGTAAGTYTFLPIPEVVALQKKLGHGL